jgi:mutator protein MutT
MSIVDSRLPAEFRKTTDIAIAVVEDNDCFLVGKRPAGVPLAGLWEFPGGKVHEGETTEHAAARECREETGQLVRVIGELTNIRHDYGYGALHLYFFDCRVERRSELLGLFRWVSRAELAQLKFPPANRRVIELLCGSR